jgi:oxazoline/thiazoline synthase
MAATYRSTAVEPGRGARCSPVAILDQSQTAFADQLRLAAPAYELRLTDEEREARVLVCVCDSYLDPVLSVMNRQALAHGFHWVPVWANWIQPWVGPIFGPETLCHACLAKRVAENRQIDNYIRQDQPAHQPFQQALASHPALDQAAPAFVLQQVAQALIDPEAWLWQHILVFDFIHGRASRHRALHRPQCPVCGPHAPAQQVEVVLGDGQYAYCWGGERRSCPPSVTWQRYHHHISPITGVVSSLVSKATPDQDHLHAYAAGHAFPVKQGDLATLKGNLRHRSGGKGALDMEARVGALCEAVERYSGLASGEEEVVHAAFADLDDRAIHPNALALYSEEQYRDRLRWNRECVVDFQRIPHPLDEHLAIDWCRVWSLTAQEVRLVPACYCYYGHGDLRHFFCACDSNGCAAGNTLEEAIVRGFMELVERDSVAIWWYNRTRQPAVDIHSFHDPYLELTMRELERSGRSLWAIDLTTDLDIPAIAAISHRRNHSTQDIIIGFSADLDPKTALLRAVSEVGQFIPALSQVDHQGNTRYHYEDQCAIDWWKSGTLAEHPYLLPASSPGRSAADFPDASSSSQRAEVAFCLERTRACGLEFLALNQTRPDIALPVAKVMVPGMRHFWNRLAPGRLYQVPVALGRLPTANGPDQLNPIPMFF